MLPVHQVHTQHISSFFAEATFSAGSMADSEAYSSEEKDCDWYNL
jgi:hypothetical protein